MASEPKCSKCRTGLWYEESIKAGVCIFCRDNAAEATVQPLPAPPDHDSATRKATPLFAGCLAYFPDALLAVAQLSKQGNDKHNPGEPLHWSKGKSADHADCLARHLLTHGQTDPDTGMSHTVALAWRALALLQTEIEAQKAGGT